MLFFTRWKAAGILLTAFVVCLFAVPNFFSESTCEHGRSGRSATWCSVSICRAAPSVARGRCQRTVRKERLQGLADDVLRMLRQDRIPFTGRAIHGNSVEVRITRESDVDNAVSKLRELSQPLSGHARRTRAAQRRHNRERRPHHADPVGCGGHRTRSARRSISRSRSSSGASTNSASSNPPSSARASTVFSFRCRVCKTLRG